MFNLAWIHEAIAERIPHDECLVYRERRFDWAAVTERTRRLADVLREHGLGCHRDRGDLQGHESGQDHVALYLYNGNEYLEGMLGCFKARVAPVNVNYRYVGEELIYLFENSGVRAVIYHACFAPTLERIRDRLPEIRLWIQVADESSETLLEGAVDYEAALASAHATPPVNLSPDDLYILYTGGTTGKPKGVLWRQEDFFRSAVYTTPVRSVDEVIESLRPARFRCLPTPPFMHGAAHWAAFNFWYSGGTVIVQSQPRRLDADDIWSTVERERVTAVTIVGDAFARPLIDQLAAKDYDVSSLRLLTSGGAILTAALKRELIECIPGLRIRDTLGSSESGSQAAQSTTDAGAATTGDFELAPDSLVLREDMGGALSAGSDERGWLARSGRVPLGYLGDPDKTAETFPTIDGVRYSVPGDRAILEADGRLRLLGRDSATINSGGEKIFAEEVEHALKHHPDVYDAVVVGTPDDRFGQAVTAIVHLRDGASPDDTSLSDVVREQLARYKTPRRYVYVDEITRSPSGKPDYRWARETAGNALT